MGWAPLAGRAGNAVARRAEQRLIFFSVRMNRIGDHSE
jgi:hypothetical protein